MYVFPSKPLPIDPPETLFPTETPVPPPSQTPIKSFQDACLRQDCDNDNVIVELIMSKNFFLKILRNKLISHQQGTKSDKNYN